MVINILKYLDLRGFLLHRAIGNFQLDVHIVAAPEVWTSSERSCKSLAGSIWIEANRPVTNDEGRGLRRGWARASSRVTA